jgi:hypothetical protein
MREIWRIDEGYDGAFSYEFRNEKIKDRVLKYLVRYRNEDIGVIRRKSLEVLHSRRIGAASSTYSLFCTARRNVF